MNYDGIKEELFSATGRVFDVWEDEKGGLRIQLAQELPRAHVRKGMEMPDWEKEQAEKAPDLAPLDFVAPRDAVITGAAGKVKVKAGERIQRCMCLSSTPSSASCGMMGTISRTCGRGG